MRKTDSNSRLRPLSQDQLRQVAGGSNVCAEVQAVIKEVNADIQQVEAAIKAA